VKTGRSEKLDRTGPVTGRPAGPVPVYRSGSKFGMDRDYIQKVGARKRSRKFEFTCRAHFLIVFWHTTSTNRCLNSCFWTQKTWTFFYAFGRKSWEYEEYIQVICSCDFRLCLGRSKMNFDHVLVFCALRWIKKQSAFQMFEPARMILH
jgi:hypothetical protein